MNSLILSAVAFLLALALAAVLSARLARPQALGPVVTNFRGAVVPVVGGVAIFGAFLIVHSLLGLAALPFVSGGSGFPGRFRVATELFTREHIGLIIVAMGFFALGALDDVAGGDPRSKGFAGHLRALLEGSLTGGTIKAIGGLAVALIAGAWWETDLLRAIRSAAIVALAANLFNLFDLRPGRCCKFFFVGWAAIGLSAPQSSFLLLSASVAGGAAGWVPSDLGERGVLGDAGANLLGAVLGAGIVISVGDIGSSILLAVLLTLNLMSEKISFTEAISRIPPLRWFDNLGRIRETGPKG